MTKATVDACRLLLLEAGRRYERHEAGRPQPFNVFSVLRKETDEVHLHSRFLRALLDYRRLPDSPRRNLADFLETFLPSEELHLDPDRARVDREFEHIDILIRDESSRHAVIIENKIEAGDQDRQLQRYDEELEERYTRRHLLYLTLDGHAPSDDSAGDLDLQCVSYKDLRPWLQRCQERACDEPELRESIAQYEHLVARLTGMDQSEEYMTALKALLQENGHLVLVHDLNAAMTEARIALLCKLWEEIDSQVEDKIHDPPERSEQYTDITEDRIRRFVTYQRGYQNHGLCYVLGPCSWLEIMVDNSIWYGVSCDRKENEAVHDRFKKELEGHGGSSDRRWCPWYRYHPTDDPLNLKNPTREQLRILASEQERRRYVADLVAGVGELWKRIKDKGLA